MTHIKQTLKKTLGLTEIQEFRPSFEPIQPPHHDTAFRSTTDFDRKGVLKEIPPRVRERVLGDLWGLQGASGVIGGTISLLGILELVKGDPLSPYHLASYLAYADQNGNILLFDG